MPLKGKYYKFSLLKKHSHFKKLEKFERKPWDY